MRAVVQRVTEASVSVSGEVVGAIGSGLLVYLGVAAEDELEDVQYMVNKIRHVRVFADDQGRMNFDVLQCGGACLVISAFTTQGDARRGHRPAYTAAAAAERAQELYDAFCRELSGTGLTVATGRFQAKMVVHSVNDGPICVLIDSKKVF